MTTPIDGTAGNDTLNGTTGADLILGYDGNDRLNGLDGDDTLDGGAGTNQIDAGAGNDTIVIDGTASNGAVRVPATGIDGGTGVDTIQFAGVSTDFHIVQIAGGPLEVWDLTTGARTLAVNVEHLQFSDTDIWLVPHNTAPVVTGDVTATASEGAAPLTIDALANASDPDVGDTLSVTGLSALPDGVTYDAASHSFVLDPTNAAFDALAAGEVLTLRLDYGVTDGTDTTAAAAVLTVVGTYDVPPILGTEGRDRLNGTASADTIFGLGGADRINGKGGDDVITGGTGADVFIFSSRFGHDTITDFDAALAGEAIDLSSVNGLHGFADLMANHVTEVAGDTIITAGLHSITLLGVTAGSLTAADFLF